MKHILALVLFPLHLFGVITPLVDESTIQLLQECHQNELKILRITCEKHITLKLIPADASQRNYHARIQDTSRSFHFFCISNDEDAVELAQRCAKKGAPLDWYYLIIANGEDVRFDTKKESS